MRPTVHPCGALRGAAAGWLACLALTVVAGCARRPATGPHPADTLQAEAWLYGLPLRCHRDAGCPTGLCYRGTCAGLLDVDGLWAQRLLGERIARRSADHPELRAQILAELTRAAGDPARGPVERARAAAALGQLGLCCAGAPAADAPATPRPAPAHGPGRDATVGDAAGIPEPRDTARRASAQVADVRARLRALRHDPAALVRFRATVALTAHGDPEAAEALAAELPRLRGAAALLAIEALVDGATCCAAPSPCRRAGACAPCVRCARAAETQLARLVGAADAAPALRVAAARGLVRLGTAPARQALRAVAAQADAPYLHVIAAGAAAPSP